MNDDARRTRFDWQYAVPSEPGYYWYHHPASYEAPAIVRLATSGASRLAYFGGIAIGAPLSLLAGGRWAGPLPPPV